MSIDFKLHIRHLAIVILFLPMLCACSSENDVADVPPLNANANQFINLQIVVSTGNENAMRAPAGGEEGDGREVGSERENEVEGITLMLYEDANGINMSDQSTATIVYAKYFPVSLSVRNNNNVGSAPTGENKEEVVYTTGNQSLKGSQLDMTKAYHAIVVANLDLTDFVGQKVTTVRDYVVKDIYTGTGFGVDADNFVMSLEKDVELDFKKPDRTESTSDGTTTYFFDNIVIERLAARVDFWTANATYKANHKGYEYSVYKAGETTPTSKDKFVLTGITPFNLFQGEEYLIKRTDDTSNQYLHIETTTNNVEDRFTFLKNEGNYSLHFHPLYRNPLSDLDGQTNLSNVMGYQSAEGLYGSNAQKASFTGDGQKDNFIICYPKENTLSPSKSPLYYYATGLRIEGDYYEEGWEDEDEIPNPKIKHLVYYGFLRHQGESTTGAYPIYSKDELNKTQTSGTAMNFGIVRNNIYRVSIGRVTEKREHEDPSVQMVIEVKRWDTFIHDVIYM